MLTEENIFEKAPTDIFSSLSFPLPSLTYEMRSTKCGTLPLALTLHLHTELTNKRPVYGVNHFYFSLYSQKEPVIPASS